MRIDYFAWLLRVVRPTGICADCGQPATPGTLCVPCADDRDLHTSALEQRFTRREAA